MGESFDFLIKSGSLSLGTMSWFFIVKTKITSKHLISLLVVVLGIMSVYFSQTEIIVRVVRKERE